MKPYVQMNLNTSTLDTIARMSELEVLATELKLILKAKTVLTQSLGSSSYTRLTLRLNELEVEQIELQMLRSLPEEIKDLAEGLESQEELLRFYAEKLEVLEAKVDSECPLLNALRQEKAVESDLRNQSKKLEAKQALLEEERIYIGKYVSVLENTIYNSKIRIAVNKRLTSAAKGVSLT